MGRWAPGSRGRLERAAMELYAEHGFEATTVAAIADRAGLTERTFFRHFADKREVLFQGSSLLQELLVREVQDADAALAPVEAVVAALQAAAVGFFDADAERPRFRQAIIDASPELQERELIKLATLATAVAGALRERGVGEPADRLAAEAGIAVFRVAFEAWVREPGDHTLSWWIRTSADELRGTLGG
ncbi:TetR/AcrR family transcriptional regulator [Aquihabitans sp. G128]|uniref:TetR/AcrR family transcriptional regulator n=1 Tax=Aquihabitans sp. G128 TaxID=2849779 RepID=UPI001C233A3B|nr:TetR/AcrR family transcriptional regulator [Aquihabitans sp. G128]QXC61729.1 TetR/AcrR family transcriptional regulator [Aquihabitans sp. G128]